MSVRSRATVNAIVVSYILPTGTANVYRVAATTTYMYHIYPLLMNMSYYIEIIIVINSCHNLGGVWVNYAMHYLA